MVNAVFQIQFFFIPKITNYSDKKIVRYITLPPALKKKKNKTKRTKNEGQNESMLNINDSMYDERQMMLFLDMA